ncbi:hypothetical protein TIFTF001_009587 [Ficus carica]|uniref:Uncharacterized protein n=1 Tax=Ficus carica TaxID=3494 RepID=A0AA87ZND6_FICCA|nr:hypothetical protein TIFTF001_009587 [Ficus carica]
MATEQEKRELDAKARQGETVVPGGTGGKSLEAQEHLAEANKHFELVVKDNEKKEQIGHEGYKEMGRKGGLSTIDKSGEERAAEEGIQIDESKFRSKNKFLPSDSEVREVMYLPKQKAGSQDHDIRQNQTPQNGTF